VSLDKIPRLGSRVQINDPDSRFHGEVGTVAAIYQGYYSSHLIKFADGWSAVFPVQNLEQPKEAPAHA